MSFLFKKVAAQDSLPTVGGYVTLKKDGKRYKILKDWGGGEYIVADPNGGDFQVKYYEHLEGLKHYGEDAAEFRIVHAKGVAKWWVEPNVSMFGGEWGNGRKEFATREEAEKYAKGTGKTYIVRDECEGEDAAEFKVGDKVVVRSGGYGKIVAIKPNGMYKIEGGGMEGSFPASELVKAADSAAMDRGNYTENTEALLRMALGNLRKASGVVRQAASNIGNAMFKVKDEQTKGFLKRIYPSWWRSYKEIEDVISEVELIAIPTAYGIPHKEKVSPEDRDLFKDFFE